MTKTIHISLDLETWGTRPGCDIRSIGACVFDPETGRVGWPVPTARLPEAFYIATDNPVDVTGKDVFDYPNNYDETIDQCRKYPLTRDPKTVRWWNDQSDEARAAFTDPGDLREALCRFTIWLNSICTPTSVPPSNGHTNLSLWSHGAAFDPPILAAAYEACGLPVPWHYRAPRDTRTAFDMAGITDHSAHLAAHSAGTAHHALSDAITQARAVCAAYARLLIA